MSRASRDTILGWTKSGAPRLLLEFQRASACRETARREPCAGLHVAANCRRPSDERHARIGTRRTRAQSVDEADGAAATGRASRERARSGEDTVMAHASVAERGRARGSRFLFDTADSASATDRRRPEVALA